MRKILTFFLVLSVAVSFDCKDFMGAKQICHLKKSQSSSVKPHCHGTTEKSKSKKDCSCPEKGSISFQDVAQDGKQIVRFTLVLDSPVNFLIVITNSIRFNTFQITNIPEFNSLLSTTKTILLLI